MSTAAKAQEKAAGAVQATHTPESRLERLKKFETQMNKKYGQNAVIVGTGEPVALARMETGSPELDVILGGGIPCGRIIEIYGPEASGKSTICFSLIAKLLARPQGGTIGYIDAEHALDETYLLKLGADPRKMMINQPDNAEQALEILEDMVDSAMFDVLVVDSVAALVPKSELEGDMGAAQMGLQARLMSQAMRKLTAKVSNTNTTIIFINQIRMKIGVMYGNPETTTGGNALKFYASVRLDVRRTEAVKNGEQVIGQKMRIKTIKNKTAMPYQTAEVILLYGIGFDQITGVYEQAVEKKIFVRVGGRHYFMGDKDNLLAVSRAEMINRLKTDEKYYLEIKELNAKTPTPEKSDDEEEDKSKGKKK
jgi:recombination protein RecA